MLHLRMIFRGNCRSLFRKQSKTQLDNLAVDIWIGGRKHDIISPSFS